MVVPSLYPLLHFFLSTNISHSGRKLEKSLNFDATPPKTLKEHCSNTISKIREGKIGKSQSITQLLVYMLQYQKFKELNYRGLQDKLHEVEKFHDILHIKVERGLEF